MSNPYQAPTSATPTVPSSGRTALFVIGLVCAIFAALIPTLVVPQFGQIFESFGADVPLMTRLVLQGYLALWALPVFVVLAWLFWPRPQRRAAAACWIGVLSIVLLLPLCIGALYLPIFMLAQSI